MAQTRCAVSAGRRSRRALAHRSDFQGRLSHLHHRRAGPSRRDLAAERQPAVAGRAMRRRTTLVALIACLVPLSGAAQPAGTTTPRTQGPMLVEQIHSGFLAAPDVKITEVDRTT